MTSRIPALALSALLGAGCFDSATKESSWRGPAEYDIQPDGVHCLHADEVTELQQKPCFKTECIWYCATFQGKAERWVSMDFEHCGDGWERTSTFTQNGLCY